MKYKILILAIAALFVTKAVAQDEAQPLEKEKKPLEWTLDLGFNIGGTMPMPLPEEIRKISTYNPKVNPQIAIGTTHRFDNKWGITTRLGFEVKGMRVRDEVKYMRAKVLLTEKGEEDKKYVEGYFVGKNTTNISLSYLTLSVSGVYQINNKWDLNLGMYASNTLRSKFNGDVSDGYLREGTPDGPRIGISADEPATFDFSEDLRDFDAGVLLGAKFHATDRIGVFGGMSFGLTDIFYKGSNPISFKMQNVYGNIGVSYRLN